MEPNGLIRDIREGGVTINSPMVAIEFDPSHEDITFVLNILSEFR